MRKSTAGVRFPGTKECNIDGCDRPRWDARGTRCLDHRFTCIVPGCLALTIQKSTGRSSGQVCWTHKMRFLKTGSYESICAVDGCENPNANKSGKPRCGEHRGHIAKEGYRVVGSRASGKSARKEHSIIMEEIVGRPLFPHENVHHKNGQKADNRPSNLELWSKSQPSGQRVEDKIMWATEFLAEYGYDVIPNAKAIRL